MSYPVPDRPPPRRSVRRARTLVATLLALVGGAALPAHAQRASERPRDDREQMERPEVRRVRFVGARALETDELRDAIATEASACKSLIYRFTICPFTKSPAVYERRYLDRTELARDVVRLLVVYYKRGWRDAAVDTTVTRAGANAVDVTFTITEREPTRLARIVVDDPRGTLRPRDRRRLLGLAPGDPLDLLRLDSAVVRVRDAYWERGYGDVQVRRPAIAVDTAADTAQVAIAVARGPLTPIASIDILRLSGEATVSDETIRNSLSIKPGDLFRRSEIARSQRALYESGLFRSALIDTAVATGAATGRTVCAQQSSLPETVRAPATGDSSKALVVCVVEAPLQEASVSTGFTTADFVQVGGRYSHLNWLGGARRLDVQATVGNLGSRQLYRALPAGLNNAFLNDRIVGGTEPRYFLPTYTAGAEVRQRWFGSPRNTLATGLFVHRRSSPGVFVDRGQGANLSFTRELAATTPASATYRFEFNRVEASEVYFCVNFGVCDLGTVSALGRAQRLSPLAISTSTARVDNPLAPGRGFIGRAELQHASAFTLSDFRYNRISAELSVYRPAPFLRGATLAARVRGGYVVSLGGTVRALGIEGARGLDGAAPRDVLHPRTRFYAGGSQSVRGFGENQLGPRVLTIAPDDIRGRVDTDTAGRTVTTYACPEPTPLATCFAQRRDALGDQAFTPRPLGGTTLVEGNVELRVPVWREISAAFFVDGAMLGERSLRDLANGASAITPGIGFRYRSPVGAVRADLGFRPSLREALPVVTEIVDSTGARRLVDLTGGRQCAARGASAGCQIFPRENTTGLRGFARRLVLHLSIGEAF